ncbi:MAG: NAD(P)-dependent oxidoreductase [Syntrophotaleaceae bacterium]
MTASLSTVLLTGATGFIGFHVACSLARDTGFQVICIVRKKHNEDRINALKRIGVLIREGCFFDQSLLEEIFKDFHVQYVVHLAAVRGAGAGKEEEYRRINEVGTEVLLQQSVKAGVQRFLYCSSVGVFGTVPSLIPAGIETALKGDNLYHQSKIRAEDMVKKFSSKGIDICIVRPTITYGSGDNGFPATLIRLVQKKRFLLCSRDVKIHLLDVTYLSELIRCLLKKERLKSSIYIAADGAPVSLKDLVNIIHRNKHGKDYPSYLSMPGILFDCAVSIFKMLKFEKWLVRILLISRSWYYDTSIVRDECIELIPPDTKKKFLAKNM